MDPSAALKAFTAVFPAELPDKTMIATIVLVAQHRRPLAVWCGAAAAFVLHVGVAVTAGQLLSRLPDTAVALATAALFTVGAVVLWRSGDDAEPEADAEPPAERAWLGAFASSFAVIAVAEWGDLTQLATASIAASTRSPVAVAAGALAALWLVAAIAATCGRAIQARISPHKLRRGAAVIFAALAAVTLAGL